MVDAAAGRQPSFTGTLLETITPQPARQPASPAAHLHSAKVPFRTTPHKKTHTHIPHLSHFGLNRRKSAFAANETSRGAGDSGLTLYRLVG